VYCTEKAFIRLHRGGGLSCCLHVVGSNKVIFENQTWSRKKYLVIFEDEQFGGKGIVITYIPNIPTPREKKLRVSDYGALYIIII